MASPSALNMLFDLASKAVDAAAKDLAVANKANKEAQEKSVMLDGYKQGYINNLNQQMKSGVGKEMHLNYHHFLGNLEQVINGQADVVTSAQYECDKMREVLQMAQRKKMSYEVLIKQGKKKAMAKASKQDQKMMDEFAMRAKRTNSSTH